MYEEVKPDVLVLGSSRVLEFRPQFFSVPMVNAGKGMGSVVLGYHFLNEALKIHRPRHIIIGVDFWWFNEAFDKVENISLIPPNLLNPVTKLNNYLLPLKWVYDGKISLDQLSDYASNCHFGAAASSDLDGYGPRGSYFYNSQIYGLKTNQDNNFDDAIERIKLGTRRFQHSDEISAGHYQNFLKLVEFLEKEEIPVTFFLPPIAKEIYLKMKASGKYDYVWDLEKAIVETHDGLNYHNSNITNHRSCEFIDGFHAGDVPFSRLLEDMANKKPELKKFLDVDAIKLAEQKAGYAYSEIYEFVPDGKEVSFLNIGCEK